MDLLSLDTNLTLAIYRWGESHPAIQTIFLGIASIFVYLIPIVLLWLYFREFKDKLASAKIFITAMLTWQVLTSLLGSWLYSSYGFRDRPFALDGLQELFFERPEKAFPSDHAGLMMAVALALLGYKYSKLGWIFLVITVISSFGRVAVGFHFIGDILGGWLLAAVAYGIVRALDGQLDRLLIPLLNALPGKKQQ